MGSVIAQAPSLAGVAVLAVKCLVVHLSIGGLEHRVSLKALEDFLLYLCTPRVV